jgi:hypothetical protein
MFGILDQKQRSKTCRDTAERFLEVWEDYESGGITKRLQKEFSEVGIEVEGLKVEIENMEEVENTKAAINKRYRNQYRVHEKVFISNINFETKKAVKRLSLYSFESLVTQRWFMF